VVSFSQFENWSSTNDPGMWRELGGINGVMRAFRSFALLGEKPDDLLKTTPLMDWMKASPGVSHKGAGVGLANAVFTYLSTSGTGKAVTPEEVASNIVEFNFDFMSKADSDSAKRFITKTHIDKLNEIQKKKLVAATVITNKKLAAEGKQSMTDYLPRELGVTAVQWVTAPEQNMAELARGSVWLSEEAAKAAGRAANDWGIKAMVPWLIAAGLAITFLPFITGRVVKAGRSGMKAASA
jgi:hypothetical protein